MKKQTPGNLMGNVNEFNGAIYTNPKFVSYHIIIYHREIDG